MQRGRPRLRPAGNAFERIGQTLRFLGGTEVTDYMGPVGVPERQDAIAKELWTALLTREDWADADLRGLPEDQPWLGLLRDAAAGLGLTVEETDDQSDLVTLPSELERLGDALRAAGGAFEVSAARVVPDAGPLDRGVCGRYQRAASRWPASRCRTA